MVDCENLSLHSAFFRNSTVCIEANSTTACSLCLMSLCRKCVHKNHHICHHNLDSVEALVLTDARSMVTWIFNRLQAANKYIGTIEKRKTAYYLRDLLMCKDGASYTDAACVYFGRLLKNRKIKHILDSIHIGTERSNSKLQLVLCNESKFDSSNLIREIMNIVDSNSALKEVTGYVHGQCLNKLRKRFLCIL